VNINGNDLFLQVVSDITQLWESCATKRSTHVVPYIVNNTVQYSTITFHEHFDKSYR
jgi:hypothetical protein